MKIRELSGRSLENTTMAAGHPGSVRLAQTSPAFLHANSTSHTWPFSAIAEIIDNAYDPDVAASLLHIDVEERMGRTCLLFTDNGNGMTQDKLHKMLSFGFCEKREINGHKPVGHYGNGFKSGSMRLAKDAFVLTKSLSTMSVGFLSQTYLADIKATTVMVPMLTWSTTTKKLVEDEPSQTNKDAICQHSLFKTEGEILSEFEELQGATGTRIILYNLKRGNDDKLELDFESNSKDVMNPESMELDFSTTARPVMEHVPEYVRSLREYCSILFLKPRMKIMLRGYKVKTKLISKSLSKTEKDVYKPVYLNKAIKIIFGFSNSKEDYGLMMYHRNRLIKAYERVGCQKQANDHGVGVVAVVELDFLEPIHNKQDFNKTDRYNSCVYSLGQKLNDYWYTMTKDINPALIDQRRKADWTWVQCDNCLKWRRLPDGRGEEGLPDKWFCYMNPDPTHNRCDVEEEPEDEDELLQRASYNKVKKKVEPRKTEEIRLREQALMEKEKELAFMQQTIQQSLEPLAPPGARSHQPTLADLEAAQKELERSKAREEEQTRIIEMLKRQSSQIQQGQRKLRQDMANVPYPNGKMRAPAPHRQGPPPRPGYSPPGPSQMSTPGRSQGMGPGPNRQRMGNHAQNNSKENGKRRSTARKEMIALPGGDAVIVTRNETSSSSSNSSSSDDESDASTKPRKQKKLNASGSNNRLLVKLPEKRKKPKAEEWITIDSDDDSDDSPPTKSAREDEDVKPNKAELDKQVQQSKDKESKDKEVQPSKDKQSKDNPVQQSQEKKVPQSPEKKSQQSQEKKDKDNKDSSSEKNNKNKKTIENSATAIDKVMAVTYVQTDPLKDDSAELQETRTQLSDLRHNVRKLLHTILPDLQLENLEHIDEIVRVMVKVNKNGDTPSVEAMDTTESKTSNGADKS